MAGAFLRGKSMHCVESRKISGAHFLSIAREIWVREGFNSFHSCFIGTSVNPFLFIREPLT